VNILFVSVCLQLPGPCCHSFCGYFEHTTHFSLGLAFISNAVQISDSYHCRMRADNSAIILTATNVHCTLNTLIVMQESITLHKLDTFDNDMIRAMTRGRRTCIFEGTRLGISNSHDTTYPVFYGRYVFRTRIGQIESSTLCCDSEPQCAAQIFLTTLAPISPCQCSKFQRRS
jgi:hypothetical protein